MDILNVIKVSGEPLTEKEVLEALKDTGLPPAILKQKKADHIVGAWLAAGLSVDTMFTEIERSKTVLSKHAEILQGIFEDDEVEVQVRLNASRAITTTVGILTKLYNTEIVLVQMRIAASKELQGKMKPANRPPPPPPKPTIEVMPPASTDSSSQT